MLQVIVRLRGPEENTEYYDAVRAGEGNWSLMIEDESGIVKGIPQGRIVEYFIREVEPEDEEVDADAFAAEQGAYDEQE